MKKSYRSDNDLLLAAMASNRKGIKSIAWGLLIAFILVTVSVVVEL